MLTISTANCGKKDEKCLHLDLQETFENVQRNLGTEVQLSKCKEVAFMGHSPHRG